MISLNCFPPVNYSTHISTRASIRVRYIRDGETGAYERQSHECVRCITFNMHALDKRKVSLILSLFTMVERGVGSSCRRATGEEGKEQEKEQERKISDGSLCPLLV